MDEVTLWPATMKVHVESSRTGRCFSIAASPELLGESEECVSEPGVVTDDTTQAGLSRERSSNGCAENRSYFAGTVNVRQPPLLKTGHPPTG
jgi:hypothetical protein